MFTLINCIIYWAALFAVAAFVLAIINLVKTHNLEELVWDIDDDYVENYLDIKNIEDYLEELEKGINHNVDMSNFTLKNFKKAIEDDRRKLQEVEDVVEIHQDVLEKQHTAMKILDENVNDTLDLIEDIMIYDDLAEEETTEWCCCKTWEDDDFEYFETKETKKTRKPKKQK